MKLPRKLFIAITFLLGAFFLASSLPLYAQVGKKALPRRYIAPAVNYGFVPPSIDFSYLKPSPALKEALLPVHFDWRESGKVSSVKNQNPYGTCWAFASIGDLESKVLINESTEYDYSEFNIVACNPQGNDCNSGGNAWVSTNYLTQLGSVDESCDPYPGDCATNPTNPTCNNPSCTFLKQVTGWLVITNDPGDVTTIKNAIYWYGPVYTAMYAGFSAFQDYDGNGCLSYAGSEEPKQRPDRQVHQCDQRLQES